MSFALSDFIGDGSLCSSASVEKENDIDEQSRRHTQRQTPQQSQQGNAKTVLVENNFSTASVSHGDQSFPQYFLQLQCAGAQLLRFSVTLTLNT